MTTTRDYTKSSDTSLAETNEYEEMESSCQVRRKTIIPKVLNNIYNKLTKVLNNETFVQAINIEECMLVFLKKKIFLLNVTQH